MSGRVAGRVHGENRGTAADIKDDLVLEKVGVLVDGIAVAPGADLIFLSLSVSFYPVVFEIQSRRIVPAFPRGCLHARISRIHKFIER